MPIPMRTNGQNDGHAGQRNIGIAVKTPNAVITSPAVSTTFCCPVMRIPFNVREARVPILFDGNEPRW